MAQYLSYRNGSTTLKERIPNALAHFQVHIGASPAALIVNPRNIAEATEILKALDLATLDVKSCGGVALQEVWLQEPVLKREEVTTDKTSASVQSSVSA